MLSNKLLFQFQHRHRVILDKKLYFETENNRFILYSCTHALFFQVESYRMQSSINSISVFSYFRRIEISNKLN